jgi:hypothetical protein
MPDDLVARLNAFTANKHLGHVGVSLTHCEATRVEGRLTVTEAVVAGTGFLWAPVVITLSKFRSSGHRLSARICDQSKI